MMPGIRRVAGGEAERLVRLLIYPMVSAGAGAASPRSVRAMPGYRAQVPGRVDDCTRRTVAAFRPRVSGGRLRTAPW